MSVPKRSIFDHTHTMFVGVHPAFDKKSEVSKYQNSTTLVAMAIEKYQWNVMIAGETNDLDDFFFSSNLFSLVDMQTMDMDFHLEVKTTIRDVTVKVKIKATLQSLGYRFKAFLRSGK